jgi:hypothetical protein
MLVEVALAAIVWTTPVPDLRSVPEHPYVPPLDFPAIIPVDPFRRLPPRNRWERRRE